MEKKYSSMWEYGVPIQSMGLVVLVYEKYKELGIIFLVLLALRWVRELVSSFEGSFRNFFFFFLRNSALLKQNDVQKVKNPRGYTGSVLKSLQGSKL